MVSAMASCRLPATGRSDAPLIAWDTTGPESPPWVFRLDLRFLRFLRAPAIPGGIPPVGELLTPVFSAALGRKSSIALLRPVRSGAARTRRNGQPVSLRWDEGYHRLSPSPSRKCRTAAPVPAYGHPVSAAATCRGDVPRRPARATLLLHPGKSATIESPPPASSCKHHRACGRAGPIRLLGNRPTVGQRTLTPSI